jgi:DNA transformation protein
MAKDHSFKDFVLDQLNDLRDVTARAMFGSYRLYRSGMFFGLISQQRLYFKTDETTRPHYIARGMNFFRPNAKQTLKSYYEAPAEIIEDAKQLTEWVQQAINIKPAAESWLMKLKKSIPSQV